MTQAEISPDHENISMPEGLRKVTGLLLAMGKPMAERLIKRFSEEELRLIAQSSKALPALNRQVIDALVTDFASHFVAHSGIDDNGNAVDALLVAGLGEERRASLYGRRETDQKPVPVAPKVYWPEIEATEATKIAALLCLEHPQVVAVTLMKFAPSKAGEVLAELPDAMRGTIAQLLLNKAEPKPYALRAIECGLYAALNAKDPEDDASENRGKVAAILNALGRDKARDVLSLIGAQSPDEAKRIEALLFDFEDLIKVSAKARVLILDGIDSERLGAALSGADDALRIAVLDALGARMKRMVEAELNAPQPPKSELIIKARRFVAERALSLAGQGVVTLTPETVPNG